MTTIDRTSQSKCILWGYKSDTAQQLIANLLKCTVLNQQANFQRKIMSRAMDLLYGCLRGHLVPI